jgi:hypothetical protein
MPDFRTQRRHRAYARGYADAQQDITADPSQRPPTLDEIKRWTEEEINARWPEVQEALRANAGAKKAKPAAPRKPPNR